MNIYLLRHPKPNYPQGVCYGRTDMSAEKHDHQQTIQHVCRHLGGQLNRIISSPLSRCLNLAYDLGNALNLEIEINERVQEMDFGDWEGKPWANISHDQIHLWQKDLLNYTPPNGEPVLTLLERSNQLIDELIENEQGGDILIITHAGVIRSILHRCGIAPLDQSGSVQLDFGGITHLHFKDNNLHVERVNIAKG